MLFTFTAMKIKVFEFNPFQENTYVVYDETGECVIVDPGCYERQEKEELTRFIADNQLTVKKLLNTHCHIDHVLGNAFVKNTFKVDLYMHKDDEPVLKAVKVYAPNYGFHQYEDSTPDHFLNENDMVTVGNQKLNVLFLPGHAPGHIAFYHETEKAVIGGDVLFYNSIGRTDLPGGNHQTLINSIQQKLFALPDDVVVYPGHGQKTTIGYEKRTNPFCRVG
jgi:hydroxyacylglutathione hydrolase